MGVWVMSYYQYQQANEMSYYTPHTQTKFHSSQRPSDPCTTPPQQPSHGVCVQANPIVVLNALGCIGFKVVTTCGDTECYLWTVERNLDADLDFVEVEPPREVESKNKYKGDKENGSGYKGKRRHSLAATLNFLHLH